MKITDEVYLVGSGQAGFSMTDNWDCNVYLVHVDGELALIDAGAGMGVSQILDNIKSHGFDPAQIKYVFITHCHADHGGGAVPIKDSVKGVFVLPEASAEALRTANEHPLGLDVARADGVYPPDYFLKPFTPDMKVQTVKDGDTFTLGSAKITAIHFPGHSVDSTCYLVKTKSKKYLFSGDTIYVQGVIGLLNCIGSELGPYRENVHKLAGLDVDCLMPGHYTFTFNNGQRHIDTVVENFKRLWPPKNLF